MSEPALNYDAPYYTLHGQPFVPKIFDAGPGEAVPEGFNAVRICLDAGMRSDLNWREGIARADQHRAVGLKLLWDLDLGLFSRLSLALSDRSQLQALRLSLAHFADTVWPKFAEETLGMAVYRGAADFSELFPWDLEHREGLQHWLEGAEGAESAQQVKSLFCRDVCSGYLAALTAGLPGNLQPYLLLDVSSTKNVRHQLQLLHRERWDRFALCVKGSGAPLNAMSWDTATSPFGYLGRRLADLPVVQNPSWGLCLPAADVFSKQVNEDLDQALGQLQGKPYRVIAEEFLTAEWDGLDYLLVIEAAVGPLTRRKLQGFSAAGGTVIYI